jgi:hypothetical protein
MVSIWVQTEGKFDPFLSLDNRCHGEDNAFGFQLIVAFRVVYFKAVRNRARL